MDSDGLERERAGIQAFRPVAERFCTLVESERAPLRAILASAVALIAAALELPDIEPSEADYDDPDDLDDDCRLVATRIGEAVRGHDPYWEVFDPRLMDEPVAGSLIDDLSDIYRDLRRGLAIASAGFAPDALWEWRFSFESHWGNHAVDAIRVLHRVVVD
ncbi:MAG: DUF5063 domain-containing protein [Acidobacteria bacterium]|nr:DUF5063 domain-containing protein [Acidobacteriota bacterium]